MKLASVALVAACLSLGGAYLYGQEATLSDSAIADAIKVGQSGKFDQLVSQCSAHAGFGESFGAGIAGGLQNDGSYAVTVSANAGRIAFMAASAKKLYKTLTLAQIPDDLKEPAAFVAVEPEQPSRSQRTVSVAAPIEHVVLQSKDHRDITVQPTHIDSEPVEWQNLLGAKIENNRAIARFSLSDVKELPPGDVDVVVIAGPGERRCKVGAKDRARLFGADQHSTR